MGEDSNALDDFLAQVEHQTAEGRQAMREIQSQWLDRAIAAEFIREVSQVSDG